MPVWLLGIPAYLLTVAVAWYTLHWLRPDSNNDDTEAPNEAIAFWWPLYLLWRMIQFVGGHLRTAWRSAQLIQRVDRMIWLLSKKEVPDSRFERRPHDRLFQGRLPGVTALWQEIQTKDFTTGRVLYLPVPPEIVRVRQGLAWGFDIAEEDYDPETAG